MTTLGKRIHELRKKAELTQANLAKKIKISHTQMVRYESDSVLPQADILKNLADVFGTTIDYLVRGDKDQKAKEALKDSELLTQFQAVEQLSDKEKITIKDLIDAYIKRSRVQQIVM